LKIWNAPEEEAPRPAGGPETLLVMHIPKTAGTSLRAVVDGEYAVGESCAIYPGWPEARAEVAGFPASRGPFRAFIGHFAYGLHEEPELRPFLHDRVRYAVFLRDPVRRVVSHFNYVALSRHPGHRKIMLRHPTLELFLQHSWARNVQTCFVLGGHFSFTDRAPLAAGRVAADRLRDAYAVAGIAERFDESVVLCASEFGWRLPAYAPAANVSATEAGPDRRRAIRVEDLSPALIKKIRAANRADETAYALALEAFERRCDEVPGFRERLARYRRAAGEGPVAASA